MNKKPSDSTERLIEALHTKRSLWDELIRPSPRPDEIIRQIQDAGELAAIADLLPILIIGDQKSILAGAQAVHHLLQQLKPADYVRFDEFFRQGYGGWHPRRRPWFAMKPEDVSHLARLGDISVSLLGIASSHNDGWVREAAVRELGKLQTGAELPFLLVRVNDWVPQVRAVARKHLMDRIRREYLSHFFAWLPLLLRLRYAAREDHSSVIQAVRTLFDSAQARDALYAGFESRDKIVRRFCVQLALNSTAGDLTYLSQRALDNSDPQVRREALQKLSSIPGSPSSKELLFRAMNDQHKSVRLEALRIFAQQYPEEAEQQFETSLLDGNITVREEAQYFIRQKGAFDLLAYYSQRLSGSSNRELSAAVAGVGEVGHAKDSQLLEPFFQNECSTLRAAAFHAVAKLNPEKYLDVFLLGLCDPSGKVARQATLALRKKPNLVGGQRLSQIYQNCPHIHGQRWALFLLSRINKWDSIIFLIQSLMSPNASCADLSRKYIDRWFARFNRSFATPSPAQLASLRQALSQNSLLLNAETQTRLESILQCL